MNAPLNQHLQTTPDRLVELGTLLGKPLSNPHAGGKAFVILPAADGSMQVVYLERPDKPARMAGKVPVHDTESFILAVNRYTNPAHTVLYATLEPAAFTAVLNDHQESAKNRLSGGDGAHWRDHRVVFALAKSKELATWEKKNSDPMSQEELAYFIEDNLQDFKTPEGAKMLEIALNFKAKQGVSFKSGMRLQDGQVQLEYIEQNEAHAGSNGNLKIPEIFRIEIPVWSGLGAKKYGFDARLRYKIGGGAVQLRYELVRPHKVIEQAYKDVLEQVKKGIKDVPVIFGAPE